MISAWHLLWIIPAAVSFGVVIAALAHAAGNNSRREEQWE